MEALEIDFSEMADFTVETVRKVPHEKALQIWKLTYKDYDNFHKNVIDADPAMIPLGEYVKERWDSVEVPTFKEAFAEKNIEIRRLIFRGIGVENLFAELEPVLVHRATLAYDNMKWDSDGDPFYAPGEDVYELYKVDGRKLYTEEEAMKMGDWRVQNNSVYVVRCWCTTTQREFWIYVPNNIGQRGNAIDAIAWTVRLTIENPEYIVRQGDVIIAKVGPESKPALRPYHLTGEEYTKLLRSAS